MRKIAFLILFLSSILFFLPQIISFGFGKKKIEALLEKELGGSVYIGKVSLSWNGGQVCREVRWANPEKKVMFSAEKVKIQTHLLDCLQYKDRPLNVKIRGAKMACYSHLRLIKKLRKRDLEMQFSPIAATIEKGEIDFEPTEIYLSKSFNLKTWGKVDLKQNTLDLTLGFPPKTLEKIFKTKDLPEDFLLEVPVSTSLSAKAFEQKLLAFFLKTKLSPYPWQRTKEAYTNLQK